MNDINEKIKAYLAQDEMEFFQGLELYENHPDAKKNLTINFRQNYNKGIMHNRLINELERITSADYTNRNAIFRHGPANIPFETIKKTKEQAPADFDYKIKFEDLPEELKEKVILKGQLYSELEKSKKELAALGDSNDEETVGKRQDIYKSMREMSDHIIAIHHILKSFENGSSDDNPETKELTETHSEGNKETYENSFPHLETEFNYLEMGYYKRKDLLIKLRSSVPKQEQRANSSKPDIKKKNLEKAALGREMIAVLEKYFEETKEPEK